MGDCEVLDRVFPIGFPHHVEDHGPSHHFTTIPTAYGVASTDAATPRINPGGGASVRDSKGSAAVVRIRVRNDLRRG